MASIKTAGTDFYRIAPTFVGSSWKIFWKIRMVNALPYMFGG
jgi:NitT/TauT family transport system permease protein